MRTSQHYYDPDYGPPTTHPHDPRNDYDDIDLDIEAAKDDMLRTPLFITDWLAHAATTDETPVDLTAVPAELRQATADQLIRVGLSQIVRHGRQVDGRLVARRLMGEPIDDKQRRAQHVVLCGLNVEVDVAVI